MKFFLDTANISEIESAISMGLIDGVTTNPTLMAKEGGDWREIAKKICSLVEGPVSLEVISTHSKGMIEEARELVKIGPNVVIKIPMTTEGIRAAYVLEKQGIPTNITLVFSPNQAILAGKIGASYVSPFVGRLDDIGEKGMELVSNTLTIYRNYGFKTQVIVASIRHPEHVLEAALMGAHIATIPYSVIKKLASHPLTDIGLERFLKDWEKVSGI